MIILIGIIIFLATLIYFYVQKTFSYWTRKNVHQESVGTILNNMRKAFMTSLNMLDYWDDLHRRMKNHRFFGSYQFATPSIFVKDPELIKQMFVKDFEHFSNHRALTTIDIDPIWCRGLVSLKGEKWRAMRATLSPSFTGSKMRGMFTLIHEAAKNYVNFYKAGPPQFSLEFKDSFSRLSNDIIATCAFGIEVNSLKNPTNEFFDAAKDATNFVGFLKTIKILISAASDTFKKIFKVPVFSEKAQKFFGNLIKSTLKTREEKHIIRPDMIHLLMQAKKGLLQEETEEETTSSILDDLNEKCSTKTDKIRLSELTDLDIIAQAMLFLAGGFETVATSLCLLAYEIGINSDVQDRLRAEIKESLALNNGELTYESILKMRYMDMVVSESLRKWPTGILLDRVCTKTYKIPKTFDNYNETEVTLNPGDVIMINTYGIHHDPDVYPSPEKFDPERFNELNRHKITPYNYMPFGVGPRHCIAIRFALMEMKTILAHLLLNFELYPVEKTHIPLKFEKSFQIMAKGGYWLGLKQLS